MFATYASDPKMTNGRLFREDEDPFRSCFQRDRDRIIHSNAFRRLKHKTQVFLEDEGDYFRTRLTHTIEVSQVARTLANALNLEVDLSESIALAHDLGHPPFGHTGEEALNKLMTPYGGFDHNAQAVLILTSLERHYAKWDGLNLTWEVLEGLIKHNGPLTKDISQIIKRYSSIHKINLDTFPSVEAQIASIADDIAYNHHDVLDGLRAGFFDVSHLRELPILSQCFNRVDRLFPGLDKFRCQHEALRSFFNYLVVDVIEETTKSLKNLSPLSVLEIRQATNPVVSFSLRVKNDLNIIRDFLFENMYRAPSIVEMRRKVTKVVNDLFSLYIEDQKLFPDKWQSDLKKCKNDNEVARMVANYISGMTDRYAIREHTRLIG